MGICSSCETTKVATAKLILQDGRLQEYCYPVRVSYVLNTNNVNPTTHFICSADDMDFNGVVLSLDRDQMLQLGQIYFALPLSKFKKPLQGEEMAALAVKASSALMRSGERCGCRRKLVFSVEEKSVAVVNGGRRWRREKASVRLNVIEE